ncbi:condensation domain-containing protein [Pseudomonas sp. TH31]|uniref:condensation domain-containing protein n=1 Tax=Pseudomonas sp. TH31 TaxID=2796396 RepID=UPI0019149E96|nr:condensation domain-containing protein [Pseudomonas sp. TH31]MBK5418407.1 hypothetical protein [Pseudomonas sp. TH31]
MSTFVRRESGLHVYPAAMPENVLEYVESALHSDAVLLPASAVSLPQNRLFCFTLTKHSEHLHHLRLTFSHLIFDGQCYRIFCTMLTRLYGQARVRPDPVDEAQRTRCLAPEATALQSADSVAFWKDRLSRYPLGQTLSFLKTPHRGESPFLTVRRSLGGSDYAALQAFVAASNSTLFRLIVAATAITIARYSNDQDLEGLCIAHTLDTRQQPGAPGCFTSLVPLWIAHHPDWSPRQYLSHVDQERRAVRPHQQLAPQRLLGLADERLNRNRPVLNVVVNQSEGLLPSVCPELEGLKVELIETPSTGGPYDLG